VGSAAVLVIVPVGQGTNNLVGEPIADLRLAA